MPPFSSMCKGAVQSFSSIYAIAGQFLIAVSHFPHKKLFEKKQKKKPISHFCKTQQQIGESVIPNEMRIGRYMSEWRSILKEAVAQTSLVVKFLCLLHVTNNYLCSPTMAYGISMLPTLNLSGDVLLVEHFSHRLGKVEPGDVVLVRSPSDPTRLITKRIIAMAGDTITFLPHPSAAETPRTIQVPKGHIWIQGDNMYASTDSRNFGPVPYGLIQGKVFLRVWPPHGFGSLRQ